MSGSGVPNISEDSSTQSDAKPGSSKRKCVDCNKLPSTSTSDDACSSGVKNFRKTKTKKQKYRASLKLCRIPSQPMFHSASSSCHVSSVTSKKRFWLKKNGSDGLSDQPNNILNFNPPVDLLHEDEPLTGEASFQYSSKESVLPCSSFQRLTFSPFSKRRLWVPTTVYNNNDNNAVFQYCRQSRLNFLSEGSGVSAAGTSGANTSQATDCEAGPSRSSSSNDTSMPSCSGLNLKKANDTKCEKKSVKRDKAYYFGLFGATEECEKEETQPNYFQYLPDSILEQVLCQVPLPDLLKLRLVCKRWNETIKAPKFMEWKKAYYRLKIGGDLADCLRDSISSSFCDTRVTNCFCSLINFMAKYPRRSSPKMMDMLRSVSKFKEAEAVIFERFPNMNSTNLSPWSVLAMLILLSETVWDIYETMNCLLFNGSPCPVYDIIDVLYCIATCLLFFRLSYKINHGLHYRLYYALHKFENVMPHNIAPVTVKSKPSKSRKQSIHSYSQPVEHKMTHEQMRILNHRLAPHQIIKIIAFAGTGKTSTLIEYARLHPEMKFLNVTFNRAVCEYAKKCFPPNVECRTSHSLAYEAIGKKYWHKLSLKLKPHDIIRILNKPSSINMQIFTYAKYVLQTIETFTASACEAITVDHVPLNSESQCFKTVHTAITLGSISLSELERTFIALDASKVWDKLIDPQLKQTKIVHDMYLKLYQLTHPVYDYDCIMVDEAQDCNPALLNIVLSQNVPVILVGDPNQQIYSFRGARNALASIKATHTYYLTKSFRFGPEIAYIASCCIEILKCNSRKTLVGSESKSFTDGTISGQYAVIARTNIHLFNEAVRLCCTEHRREKEPLKIYGAFAGGLQSYGFDQLLDIYRLTTGDVEEKAKITDKFIKMFRSFDELSTYISSAEDGELQGKLDLVLEHQKNLVGYIEIIRQKCSYPMELANVVFSTAHKSKGLEFDTVCITSDYRIGSVPCERPKADSPIADEYNLLYVALTRAKKCLLLSESLYKVLLLAQEKFEYPTPSSKLMQDKAILKCVNCSIEFVPHTVLVLYRRTTRMASGRKIDGGPLCMKCGTTPRFRPEIHQAPAIMFLDFVEDSGHRSMSTLVGPLPTDPPIIYDDVMMMPNLGPQHVIFQVNF